MRGRTTGHPGKERMDRHDWWGPVLDAPDGPALARFYASLLGWEIAKEDDEGAALCAPDSVAYLGFQTAPDYVRPSWPVVDGAQQMMMHLDFEVTDLETAVEHAVALGAQEAEYQPQEHVRVMLDPAGHPFCLYDDG